MQILGVFQVSVRSIALIYAFIIFNISVDTHDKKLVLIEDVNMLT